MPDPAELERLVDAVRRSGAPQVADALGLAIELWRSPVRVGVTGRRGVGKSMVRAALGVLAARGGENFADDVVIQVELWRLSPAAASTIATLDRRSSLVVVNKIDTIDADPHEICAQLAVSTGQTVVPMAATLAVAVQRNEIQPAELSTLQALAVATDPTLMLSAELFLAANVSVPAADRSALLARWSMAGIRLAVAGLAANPGLGAVGLRDLLRRTAGIDAAAEALNACVAEVRAERDGLLADELERIAAHATPDHPMAAAEIESFLDGPIGLRLGARRELRGGRR